MIQIVVTAEIACSSETSCAYMTTRCHNPEDHSMKLQYDRAFFISMPRYQTDFRNLESVNFLSLHLAILCSFEMS
jgi:hypothetical protein